MRRLLYLLYLTWLNLGCHFKGHDWCEEKPAWVQYDAGDWFTNPMAFNLFPLTAVCMRCGHTREIFFYSRKGSNPMDYPPVREDGEKGPIA